MTKLLNWEDITFREFELMLSTPDCVKEDFLANLIWSVSCLTKNDSQKLDTLNQYKDSIMFLDTPVFQQPFSSFEFEGKTYSIGSFLDEPFVKLVLNADSEFDSEAFHAEVSQKNMFHRLPDLLSLWVNEKGVKGFDHFRVEDRAREFDKLGINHLLGFYHYYCEQMGEIVGRFDLLFKKYYFKNSEHYDFISRRYGWELSVNDLCKGDITKKNAIYMSSIFDALNALEVSKAFAIGDDNLNKTKNFS